jgi:hypothetical protein
MDSTSSSSFSNSGEGEGEEDGIIISSKSSSDVWLALCSDMYNIFFKEYI